MSLLLDQSRQVTLLPLEVLLSIFELATYNSTREIGGLADLPPFESLYSAKRQEEDEEALGTKHSLALTCSLFKRLTVRLLYEDIWIGHDFDALLNTLERSRDTSADQVGLGRFVKRVFLSPIATTSAVDKIMRIISLCPNLRILSHLADTDSASRKVTSDAHSRDDVSFAQIHRVDWNDSLSDGHSSLGSAPRFLWHSPTLRVLTLSMDNLPVHVSSDEESQLCLDLPQLHALRLRSCDALGDPEDTWYSVQLPSLDRIVLERPLALYALHSGCLSLYGSQIKTLEFGRYPRFLRIDALSIGLGYCPNVESLLFPVFTTMAPAKNQHDTPRSQWVTYRVKHIGLNASVEENCDYQVSRTWMWVQLGDLVDALLGEGTRFTALERITLYGSEWRDLVEDAAFMPIARALHSKGICIECEDEFIRELVAELLRYATDEQ